MQACTVQYDFFSFFSLQKTLSDISSFTADGAELRRVTDETFALLDSLAGAAALEELVSFAAVVTKSCDSLLVLSLVHVDYLFFRKSTCCCFISDMT